MVPVLVDLGLAWRPVVPVLVALGLAWRPVILVLAPGPGVSMEAGGPGISGPGVSMEICVPGVLAPRTGVSFETCGPGKKPLEGIHVNPMLTWGCFGIQKQTGFKGEPT